MFLEIEFSDWSTIKNPSNHQSQEAKVTDNRVQPIISGNTNLDQGITLFGNPKLLVPR